MREVSIEQVRSFRLRSHHLDAMYPKQEYISIVGACGIQNSPPGAWQSALFQRIQDCTLLDTIQWLYHEKSLLQAWSIRGAPYVFPTEESDVFLSALVPEKEEPWIYTNGISLALHYLQMEFDEVFALVLHAVTQLKENVLLSKTMLDQTIASWIEESLPKQKRMLWNQRSMYGNPDVQTVGGAVVSFLLRPCACLGWIVFGERMGSTPSFVSYQNWVTHPIIIRQHATKQLVRNYLHCYGPANIAMFSSWLGCSGTQARRLWNSIHDEMQQISLLGKTMFVLTKDIEQLCVKPVFLRDLHLLAGHDPYLDQRDRWVLQSDMHLQKEIWKTVSNPGAILYRGEVVGIWTSQKKKQGICIKMKVWVSSFDKNRLQLLAQDYSAFWDLPLQAVEIQEIKL